MRFEGMQSAAVAAKAAEQKFQSDFVGVSWHNNNWKANIAHDGKKHGLGTFDDEQEAARAFDTGARRLRPDGEAHGVQAAKNKNKWPRVNFPTDEETAFAAEREMPPQKKRKARA